MTLDAGTLSKIDDIHTDVRELTQVTIPAMGRELVSLSNGIAINKRDIGGLLQWKDTTDTIVTQRGTDIMTLGHRTETLETSAKKRSANWAEIAKTLLAISQALVTAYLLSQII